MKRSGSARCFFFFLRCKDLPKREQITIGATLVNSGAQAFGRTRPYSGRATASAGQLTIITTHKRFNSPYCLHASPSPLPVIQGVRQSVPSARSALLTGQSISRGSSAGRQRRTVPQEQTNAVLLLFAPVRTPQPDVVVCSFDVLIEAA